MRLRRPLMAMAGIACALTLSMAFSQAAIAAGTAPVAALTQITPPSAETSLGALATVPIPQAIASRVVAPRDILRLVGWTTSGLVLNTVLTVGADGLVTPPSLAAVPAGGLTVGDLQAYLAQAYFSLFPGATILLSVDNPAAAPTPAGGRTPEPASMPPPTADQPVVGGMQLAVRCWSGDLVVMDATVTVGTDLTIAIPPLGKLSVMGQTLLTLRDLLQLRYAAYYPGCALSVLPVTIEGTPTELPATEEKPAYLKFPPDVTAGEMLESLPRFGASVFAAPQAVGTISPGMPAGNVPVAADYQIGPGDKLAIRSWTDGVEHLAVEVVVGAEGKAYIPLLGEMTLAGQSLSAATEQVAARSRRFYRDSQTTVVVAEVHGVDIYVTGDVAAPGRYSLPGGATVFTALYAAGGPSPVGSLRTIRLLRKGSPTKAIDAYEYLLSGDQSSDEALRTGDTVFVGPLGATVGVAGLVRRPALYEIGRGLKVAEALEMAAGLSPQAYGRNVEVWRVRANDSWNVINLDLSLPPDSQQGASFELRDGDLLLARPVLEKPANTVEITGAVRRPGTYEVGADGLDLRGLLSRAQGPDENAFMGSAALWRRTQDNDQRLIRFGVLAAQAGDPAGNLALQPGDKVQIYSRLEVLQPQEVAVQGAVAGPGLYAWAADMRVSDLLLQARGLIDGAYTGRADLRRLTPDLQREMVPVSLTRILAGDPAADLPLQPGDQLTVYRQSEVAAVSEVTISGFVQKPGTYPRTANMKASDLVIIAGGLLPEAGGEIEYVKGRTVGAAQPLRLALAREGAAPVITSDPVLGDDDAVNVLGVGGFRAKAALVSVEGMVGTPGTYALVTTAEQPDTVYKLLQRAGGLLPSANPRGIVLYRQREADTGQADDVNQVLDSFNRERAGQQPTLTAEQRAGAMANNLSGQLATIMSGGDGPSVVIPPRTLSTDIWANAVPIDGRALVTSNGREGDMPLAAGDIVVVPTTPTTVSVVGAVVRPGAVAYTGQQSALDYVRAVGGAANDASLDRLVVIRANGAVASARDAGEVYAGDVIVVPSEYVIRQVSDNGTQRALRTLATIAATLLIF